MMNAVDVVDHRFAMERYQIQEFVWVVQKMINYLIHGLWFDDDDDFQFEFVAQIELAAHHIRFELLVDHTEALEHLHLNVTRKLDSPI